MLPQSNIVQIRLVRASLLKQSTLGVIPPIQELPRELHYPFNHVNMFKAFQHARDFKDAFILSVVF